MGQCHNFSGSGGVHMEPLASSLTNNKNTFFFNTSSVATRNQAGPVTWHIQVGTVAVQVRHLREEMCDVGSHAKRKPCKLCKKYCKLFQVGHEVNANEWFRLAKSNALRNIHVYFKSESLQCQILGGKNLKLWKTKSLRLASIWQPYAYHASSYPMKPQKPCKLWNSAAPYIQ